MNALPQAKLAGFVADLAQLLGNRVSTAQAVREQHGRDESYHPAHAPVEYT